MNRLPDGDHERPIAASRHRPQSAPHGAGVRRPSVATCSDPRAEAIAFANAKREWRGCATIL
jgi:hypothetical protein